MRVEELRRPPRGVGRAINEPRYDEMRPGDEAPPGQEGAGEDLCPDCSGTGKRDGAECDTCAGTGRVEAGIGGG